MLGHMVHDPDGLEGTPGSTRGLSLLPVDTKLAAPKTTTIAKFQWGESSGTGYEIHMGRTELFGGGPLFKVTELNGKAHESADGCISEDKRVIGAYMHGLFDSPEILSRWLSHIGVRGVNISEAHGIVARDSQYDLLAAHFEKHINVDGLMELFLPTR